jgi:hypothetical protein
MNLNFEYKYLKYKAKYLELKNLIGSGPKSMKEKIANILAENKKLGTTNPVPALTETIKPTKPTKPTETTKPTKPTETTPIHTPLFCTLFENKSKNQINSTDSTDSTDSTYSTDWSSVSVLSFHTLEDVAYDQANYDITENEEIHIANVEFPPGYSYSTLDKKMDLWATVENVENDEDDAKPLVKIHINREDADKYAAKYTIPSYGVHVIKQFFRLGNSRFFTDNFHE